MNGTMAAADREQYDYMNEGSINRKLICPLCKKPFLNPVSTPCLHSFCYECIAESLRNQSSCPTCQQSLSLNHLSPMVQLVCDMLDELMVRCVACGKENIERRNFDEHIDDQCPKSLVLCRAAELRCPWQGRKKELPKHMEKCDFERMRPVLTQLIDENETLRHQLETKDEEFQKTIDDFTKHIEMLQEMIVYRNPTLEQQLDSMTAKNQPHKFLGKDLFDLDMGIIIRKSIIARGCTQLELQRNRFTDRAIGLLVYHLKDNQTVQKLNISNNSTTVASVRSLTNILSKNHCQLQKLYMYESNIDDEGAGYLAEMLKTNTTLTSLAIYANQISNQGMQLICTALAQSNRTLLNLYIQQNPSITDDSIDTILAMLRENPILSILDVKNRSFTSAGIQRLKRAVANRPNFTLDI